VVRSSIPKASADHHMFKIAFSIDGYPIDPDAYCTP
jgi:hypothetical protein